ncbi:MAG: tryptophan 7-halogenase [Acidocella sp.]|nr:tryptophan 7-halogenase [Acidocella sp.]
MNQILIAGGGLAGSAAAIALARAGRKVTLIEREAAPAHKICGEFLSIEAQSYLAETGLDLAALGAAPITHVRFVRGGSSTVAKLPFQGLSLTRKTLDEALLNAAAQAGVDVRRGHAVRHISAAGGALSVAMDGGARLSPQILLLASGKHEIRGAARLARPGTLVGFKTYFNLRPEAIAALASHVELIIFSGGFYAGLQMVEGGLANLCLLVPTALLARVGGKFPALLAHLQSLSPHLAGRLAGATDHLSVPLSIARVPYGFVYRPDAQDPPGLFRLGDQAAVIPSFSGDGMAIALHSAARAAEAVLAGRPAPAYHQQLRADVAAQIKRGMVIQNLCARPLINAVLPGLVRLVPAILPLAASLTRVPAAARLYT